MFNKIFKQVKPLQDAEAQSTETLETKKKELAVVKARVAELTARVNTLKRQLEEAETRKQIVEQDASRC
jgi:phage shock protein A